jgi:2-polyprenyl-6-methoxyphenol hydroxylase-like FAD-dependent oxidoreductase
MEVFESMGIVDEVLARGHPMKAMNVFSDEQFLGRLSLQALEGRYPFILILEQSETERILERHIESLGIRVERQVELLAFAQDEERVLAKLRRADGSEEIVRAAWLAGCDGALSTVRHVLELPFRGAVYEEEFILGDMNVTWSLPPDEAYGFLSSGNLLGFFPMGGDRFRLVATRDPADAASGKDPTLVEFQSFANKHVPVKTELSDPIWLAGFRLHR